MPKITGLWGKILNVLYNLLKWGKEGGLFNKKPGPPAAVILLLFLAGCASLGDKLAECLKLMQTCEVETSQGQCVCKPQPSPTPAPTPEPTPSAKPTPAPTPSPTPSPTPAPTPTPGICNLPPRAECGGPENPVGSGQYGCCATQGLGDGKYAGDVAEVFTAVEAIPGLIVNGRITDTGIYITSMLNGLRNRGYCVVQGGPHDEIGPKKDTNDFSEQYDIIIADNKAGYFLAALCKPARF